MRATIVGAGIMGLATAWALVRAGHQVTVLEQGEVPNPLAASSDEHRVIAPLYGPQAGYARMVEDALAAWDELWSDLAERLYVPTGIVALSSGGTWVRDAAETLAALGRPIRWLAPGELERTLPLVSPQNVEAAFAASGGVLLARRILVRLADDLVRRGATICAGQRVVDIDPARAQVRLAGSGTVDADALVIATGSWVSRLLPRLASRIVPARGVAAYVAPPPSQSARWAIAPVVVEAGEHGRFWTAPPVAGTRMKLVDVVFRPGGDPTDERAGSPVEAAALLASARRRLRDFERYRILELRACYAALAPDEDFVVERLAPQAWVVSACSGHGFKFGALLGRRIAAALLDDGRAGDISLWAAGKPA